MRARRAAFLLAPALLLLCGSRPAPDAKGQAFERGVEAYAAGRYDEARAAFAAALQATGARPSAARLHNLALSALRAGELDEAEQAAGRLAATRRRDHAALGEFLLGNAAFARCLGLGPLARAVEAEPFVLDAAIAQAERARDAWVRAALLRSDWPAARRNVERALLELADLQRAREAARARDRAREPEPEPPAPEEDPEQEPGQPSEEALEPDPGAPPELSEVELDAILARLAEKELEKLELRRARRAERSADVERDW